GIITVGLSTNPVGYFLAELTTRVSITSSESSSDQYEQTITLSCYPAETV
ncbi:hypothetical protein A2U01_0080077, partial [Trifolium medium]|nr:hypothetical protein [Trifolium medium]